MIKTDYFPFDGGENTTSPYMQLKPGELTASLNYELLSTSGYKRVEGFERFDGQTKPSSVDRGAYATEALWIAAVEAARDNITAVPGSGPIRGVFSLAGTVYAFRDNAGATACVLHKSTASGWSEVSMNYVLEFTGGTNEIFDGDTIEGRTSGATAVVTHIHVDSGTWVGNDAAGEIHFNPSTLTGNFTVGGEDIKVGVPAVTYATITAGETIETFSPSGTFEFIKHNFLGATYGKKIYGCDGENPSFEFDGTTVKFIHTGMTTDTPKHIGEFKNHLFLSFSGGSVQHSSPGSPFDWSPITGAAEIGLGEEIVGFGDGPGDVYAIFGRNKTALLYGTSVSDWNLKSFSKDSGAIEWTLNSIGLPVYLDDRGLKVMVTTDTYGDFKSYTISQKIDTFISTNKDNAAFSLRVKEKDQYRLFFTDGTVLLCTFNGTKLRGATRAYYGSAFVCGHSSENEFGDEEIYVGDSAGFVYQMDSGYNFDGEEVTAYIRPIFHHFKSPENRKKFQKMVLEMISPDVVDLYFVPEFSFGDSYHPSASEKQVDIGQTGAYWDTGIIWDQFYYDAQSQGSAYGYFTGYGKNMRLIIRSEGTYEEPHTLNGIFIHYSVKGRVK